MITVVLTSCGRLDLLARTIQSFMQFNTYPISEYMIVEDSGDPIIATKIIDTFPDWDLIFNHKKRGVIHCIDDAYSHVKTPYIFHLEDDWEFTKGGFIEDSLKILESNPNILQVWLRGENDPNGHPIEPEVKEVQGVKFRMVSTHQWGVWHGFSFNPGLRRLSDYNLIAPYSSVYIDQYSMLNQGVQENHIGRVYFEQYSFRVATLLSEYCIHIGQGRRV
jgi:hypothetical protein